MVVEIRGVEPLTFSMPLAENGLTRADAKRQSRIFTAFRVMHSDGIFPQMSMCCNLCCKALRHPPKGNRHVRQPSGDGAETCHALRMGRALDDVVIDDVATCIHVGYRLAQVRCVWLLEERFASIRKRRTVSPSRRDRRLRGHRPIPLLWKCRSCLPRATYIRRLRQSTCRGHCPRCASAGYTTSQIRDQDHGIPSRIPAKQRGAFRLFLIC